MSYTIYQTEGIILGKKNFGEADSLFFVYSKEFGRVDTVARGVRYLKSKLRYNLDNFSYVKLSLIKNRDFWRIVDVAEIFPLSDIVSSPKKLSLFSKISRLINRMVRGEEKNTALWKALNNFVLLLKKEKETKENMENLEISTALNILDNLGYIEKRDKFSKKEAIVAINKAIHESHL